eukprot:gene12553-19436_t
MKSLSPHRDGAPVATPTRWSSPTTPRRKKVASAHRQPNSPAARKSGKPARRNSAGKSAASESKKQGWREDDPPSQENDSVVALTRDNAALEQVCLEGQMEITQLRGQVQELTDALQDSMLHPACEKCELFELELEATQREFDRLQSDLEDARNAADAYRLRSELLTRDLEEMRSDAVGLSQTNADLRRELHSTHADVSSDRSLILSEIEEFRRQLTSLEDQRSGDVEKLTAAEQRHITEKEKLSKKLKFLTRELEDGGSTDSSQSPDTLRKRRERQKKSARISHRAAELEAEKDEMNALRDQCRVVEAQKAQIQRDAKAEVMQVQDRARQLEMDKVQLEVGAKNEVALLKERSRHQDQERADFKNEITVLKDVNRRQEVENNDLSSELSYTKKALSRSDTTLSAQQERSRKVEDENAALKERCYQTDAELMLARERCRQHEDNLAEYKKTTRPLKDELAAAFESVESKSTAVTSLNKELATVKLEVATLGQEVAEKSRTIARLHEEAALAEERIADRKNNREAEHAKELQTLREKHAKELQTLREKYATEVGELRAAFLSKEREVDESSSKWEATNAELHQALAEVDNLRQRLHDAVEDIGRLERESEKYSENARANQSPSMASARDCPSEQEDGVLGASVEELQGQLAENAQELAKARDIMSESADELEHAQAEIHSLQSEVKEWKAHCVAIEAELLAKRDEVSISANHSAARVAEVEAKLQEKASEVSLLKASNQQLIDALQGSGKQPQNADFERLSLEVTRLRQEKMELAVQLNSLALQFRGTDVDQKLAKVTADVTSLEIAQHKCEVQDQELRSLRTQMREASSRHASELSQLKGQVRALTGDLAEEQGKVEALVDTLTHAQQQAEANVRQLQVEIDALTMEKATTQGQTDSLRQTLQQQARKLTEAKETIGSLS